MTQSTQGWKLRLASWLAISGGIFTVFGNDAFAQITPDHTLGAESSVINQINKLNEHIDGGAHRGSNLFHSFQEFNISEGRGVYFANPTGIENILSRVTGANRSHILGTLGVLGNANLFFINPNGIIFGPNARLDIRGSFVASTANSFVFGNGFEFSATNPAAPSLLTINLTPGLQYGSNHPPAAITSTGNLAVGEDLTLSADHLDLEGQLSAGGNLTLHALETVTIRDSVTNPFVAAAGGQLLIQGNQGVDIFALNHPNSGLISGGDLVLRSSNAVEGDAHFWSGGNFQIEKLDGSLGDLSSPHDPIIRSQGDVSFGAYQGASLHILAGGRVDIGTVIITGADTEGEAINPITTPSLAKITLSDGTPLTINGQAQPTLDIRAGMNLEAIGEPLGTIGGDSGRFYDVLISPIAPPENNPVATSADIRIGEVVMIPPDGIVLLTNQYESNPLLPGGDITITGAGVLGIGGINARGVGGRGSDVILDSRNNITIDGSLIDASSPSANGGDVKVLANGDITLELGARILSNGLITITAKDTIILSGEDSQGGASAIASRVAPGTTGDAGGIKITTGALSLTDGAVLNASTYGKGNAGAIEITATDGISLAGENSRGFGSGVFSQVADTAEGNSGGIVIDTGFLSLTDGAAISANTFGKGNAGAIEITATDGISLAGESSQGFISGVFSQVVPTAEGDSGGIVIGTTSLSLTDGARIDASTGGKGNAGAIEITASEGIALAGESSQGFVSGVFSQVVDPTAEGDSGGIVIDTTSLSLTDGAVISAGTFDKGNAGAIEITATGGISLAGEDSQGFVSGVFSTVEETAEGDSGGIVIDTTSLSLTDGTRISASTFSKGNAGAIEITASGGISLAGEDSQGFVSGVFSQVVDPTAEGDSGGIVIDTTSLSLTDGARIDASTFSKGNAGAIEIMATNGIALAGESNQGRVSGVFSTVEETAEGNSGGIVLDTTSLSLSDGAVINASTRGKGNAGAIEITASEGISLTGEDSQGDVSGVVSQVTETAEGDSGGIVIDTGSLSLTDGAGISASTLGQGNAGAIEITASEGISLVGENSQGVSSNISSQTTATAEGIANSIILNTPQLTLLEGTIITASTNGQGDGGNIIINSPSSILLSKDSILSVETTGAGKPGDINITTNTLTIGEDAQLSATVTATSTNTEGGGSITLNAANLSISGKLGIFAETQSIAPAGNLILQPNNNNPNLNIVFTDNGLISASTTATGDGGNIAINAPQAIDIRGEGKIAVETSGSGEAGNIDITTQNLTLADGLEISASTTGEGDAGNIALNAKQINLSQTQINAFTDSTGNAGDILISDNDSLSLNSSAIASTAEANATGDGGEINLQTANLTLTNNSKITTSTQGQPTADAGTINIAANQITLENNSQIAATTSAGKGGSITLTANTLDAANVSRILTTTTGNNNAGDITLEIDESIALNGINTGIFAETEINSLGNGGNIFIDLPLFIIQDGAAVSVNSQGQGIGGNLAISAGDLILDNGSISAQTASNTGGNITLNVDNVLTLRNGSQISTTAGTAGAGGDGGNIDIDANFIVAVPEENSDITANAFEGNGGNIQITAQGIFGIEFREQQTPLSDITASSELGVEGVVEINTPDVDPSQGLVALPIQPVETEVVQACTPSDNRAQSEFVVTGRGGLPPTPNEALSNDAVEVDWVTLNPKAAGEQNVTQSPERSNSPPVPKQIVEAQGWTVGSNGKVTLTASVPTVNLHSPWQTPVKCHE